MVRSDDVHDPLPPDPARRQSLGHVPGGARTIDPGIERQEGLLPELREDEDKLRRAANLNLVPDLNDGVILNIASLQELIPGREPGSTGTTLMDGRYEWSTIGKQLRDTGLVLG